MMSEEPEEQAMGEGDAPDLEEGGALNGSSLEPLAGDEEEGSPGHNLEMLLDLPLEVTVELGRTRISLQELLKLDKGSVIRLGRTEGEPLDIQVNGRVVARGEVVVVNERLGVRVTEIGEARDRVRSLE
jgi:flagellar motor switch protein FliN/FliY